ncbi:MAG: substrate-binding domain-containing protein [Chlorobiales bacterium]|nr:substrate-binding domain-containing protein [Chlorobiales bacterium]
MPGGKKFVLFAIVPVLVFLAMFAVFRMEDKLPGGKVVVETAKSGLLRVGVEYALAETVSDIVPVFGRHYPDAGVKLEEGPFAEIFNRFLGKDIEAMLWSGLPGKHERSLLEKAHIDYRLEPVAKNAVVCIVSTENTVPYLCVEELAEIYTGRRKKWDKGGEIRPCLNNNDLRLQKQFLALTAPEEKVLTAWFAESDEELIHLVSDDVSAVGVLSLSKAASLAKSGKFSSAVRMVPICNKKGEQPVEPSQFMVYREEYPLVYIVYYMYRKEKALAAGFGAWLADEAQKGFARSSVAPFKQPERVIYLK